MRKWAVGLILAALMAACAYLPAMAEGDGVTTYRAALVGIDNYASSALQGCVTDANRMLATLQTANEAGAIYQQPEIRTNLKASELSSLLSGMTTWGVDDDDVTFFYFAGHGYISDKDVASIVGTDAKTVRVDRLKAALDEIPGTKIVVLDCRYADSLIEKSGSTAKDVLQKFNTNVTNIFLADPEHYYVLSGATLASSISALGATDAHGLVTYYLTGACGYDYKAEQPGDLKGDADGNGAVSLSEAKAYIDGAVAGESGAPQVQVAISPADSSYPVLARRADTEVLKVEMDKSQAEVATKYTLQLNASVSPANASRPGLTLVVQRPGRRHRGRQGAGGGVTGVRAGTARIVAMSDNGLTAACDISVRDVTFAETIKLEQTHLTLGEGTSAKLNLTLDPPEADETITWGTDDATVATVDNQGNVSAKGLGDAAVTATTERGIQATANIKVVNKGKEVTAIQLKDSKADLYEGNAMQLEYTLAPKNPEDSSVTWTSSDPDVAYINESGLLVAEKPGKTTLTVVASSGVSAQMQVTVKGAELTITPQPGLAEKGRHPETERQDTALRPRADHHLEGRRPDHRHRGRIRPGDRRRQRPDLGHCVARQRRHRHRHGQRGGRARQGHQDQQEQAQDDRGHPAGAQGQGRARQRHDHPGLLVLQQRGRRHRGRERQDHRGDPRQGGHHRQDPQRQEGPVPVAGGPGDAQVDQAQPDLRHADRRPGRRQEYAAVDRRHHPGLRQAPGAVLWASSDKKVVTVDNTGLVTAVAPGEAVIRAMSGKVKAYCKITVTGNEAVYKKPVTGKEKKVYVSARHIYYKGGNLVVEVYFANKSSKTVKLPYAGKLVLTLADGTVLELRDVEKGKERPDAGQDGCCGLQVQPRRSAGAGRPEPGRRIGHHRHRGSRGAGGPGRHERNRRRNH